MTNAQAALIAAAASNTRVLETAEMFKRWLDEKDDKSL